MKLFEFFKQTPKVILQYQMEFSAFRKYCLEFFSNFSSRLSRVFAVTYCYFSRQIHLEKYSQPAKKLHIGECIRFGDFLSYLVQIQELLWLKLIDFYFISEASGCPLWEVGVHTTQSLYFLASSLNFLSRFDIFCSSMKLYNSIYTDVKYIWNTM